MALTAYTALRPKDDDRLQELGGLYLRRADDYAQQYVAAQTKANFAPAERRIQAADVLPLAQALEDPISAAISTSTTTDTTARLLEVPRHADEGRRRLQAVRRAEPQGRHEPVPPRAGRAVREQQADAIAAYTAFLKLAPNDSLAPAAKKALKDSEGRLPPRRLLTGWLDSAWPALSGVETRGSMNFDIKTEPLSDHAFVVAIAGEVDLYVAPELKQQLLEVIGRGATHVIVDLTDATFIDSTTLGVLIGGVRRLRTNDGRLSLVCNDRNVAKIFELSGLDRVFDDLPDARARPSRASTASSGVGVAMTPRRSVTRADRRSSRRRRVGVPRRRLRRREAMTADDGDAARRQAPLQERARAAAATRSPTPGRRASIGPNLDTTFGIVVQQGFDESTIRDVVRGQIAYPETETGERRPRACRRTSSRARTPSDVADYVARVRAAPGAGRDRRRRRHAGTCRTPAADRPRSTP